MRFEIIDTQTKTNIANWLDRVIGQIRTEMHNNKINASLNLSNSLEGIITDDNHIQILANPYFLYAEKGRTAGKVPQNFADILEKWIDNKGLTPIHGTKRQFAWAIAMKIKHYGSKRYRNPSERVDLLGDVLNKELPELNEIISNRVVIYLNDNLFN
jgi:hypothetical protein